MVLLAAISWRLVTIATARAQSTSYIAAAAVPSSSSPSHGADWQQEMTLLGLDAPLDPTATSSTDHLAMIGPMVSAQLVGEYLGLQSNGSYSSSTATKAAGNIASNIRAVITYKTYTLPELTTDSDTSYTRMMQYRSDLRDSLAPLLQNTNAELGLYAKYVETSDPSYLEQLKAASQNYKAAVSKTVAVVVPRDAVNYHLAILNAMQEFAATLDAMTSHTDDALTNAALLRSYNQAEQDMYMSFNNLSSYYSQKTP